MASEHQLITLRILASAHAAQSAHGLKHDDFQRYRGYCTRRLARVRRASGVRCSASSGRYEGRVVRPADVLRDERCLVVPLFAAEREWACAMGVQRDVRLGASKAGECRARRVVLGKLARAVAWAELLVALCREVADESTVLEAEAYAKWMVATLALQREQWGPALASFEIIHRIYSGMAGVTSGTAASGVFEKRLEEVAQAMRLCEYNLARAGGADGPRESEEEILQGLRDAGDGTGGDVLANKIEKALAEARKRAAQSFGEVEWCGQTVPLRSERVREALLLASDESKALQTKGITIDAYDKLFMAYNDAVTAVNDELSEFRASTAARAEDRIAELESLVAYLTFRRLGHTVERNLLLVESFKVKRSSKPEDFVRLYDNLIGNMADVLALRGVDEDAAVSNEAEAKRTLFRAYRCFHLAQCYLALSMQSEAAALFDRVAVHARMLSGAFAKEAQKIVDESTGMKCRARAQAFLKDNEIAGSMAALSLTGSRPQKAVMVDHLDAYVSFAQDRTGLRCIAEVPPALEAVPCKPVMFDLAIDGIRFPGDKANEEESVPERDQMDAVPAKGATGTAVEALSATRLGRWWSGKS